MKIISWNVNGIRAAVKKNFVESMQVSKADVICLQETKAQPDEVEVALQKIKDYELYSNSAEKKGYSSTAILTKSTPISVIRDIGKEMHDKEGRVIAAEYDHFYIVTAYVPNSGRGLVRLEYRLQWDHDLLQYLKTLEAKKPIILCGDLNVAHQAIDLARPKPNYNKTAGYTQKEIDGFSNFIDAGFVDIFRHLYPEKISYSWWSYMFNARKKNVGWRIDYFLISAHLVDRVKDSYMLSEVMGSDHCPIVLEID